MTAQNLLELLFRLEADGEHLPSVEIAFEITHPAHGTRIQVMPGSIERDESNGKLIFK